MDVSWVSCLQRTRWCIHRNVNDVKAACGPIWLPKCNLFARELFWFGVQHSSQQWCQFRLRQRLHMEAWLRFVNSESLRCPPSQVQLLSTPGTFVQLQKLCTGRSHSQEVLPRCVLPVLCVRFLGTSRPALCGNQRLLCLERFWQALPTQSFITSFSAAWAATKEHRGSAAARCRWLFQQR